MSLKTKTLVVGPFETNCYVLWSPADCWVVDPGPGAGEVLEFLREAGARPGRIVLTHGHCDHIAGVPALRAAFDGIRLACPKGDADMLTDPMANLSGVFGSPLAIGEADEVIEAGDVLSLADWDWLALDTSGHTAGGLSYYCRDAGVVLTGDALFAEGIGRTDMPGGSTPQLLRNIRAELLALPDPTRVLPGHGPETTIGAERRGNPFLAAP